MGGLGWCELCTKEYKGAYYLEHKEKILGQCRDRHYMREYGLKPEDIPDTCEVCGRTPPPRGKRKQTPICVDHNHETGQFRGFLCHSCNLILGRADDNPAILEKLALYLRERK